MLDNVGDLNVVFGRNDSGKSNLLRALNLFFNEEIEPGRALEFGVDMSDQRKREARDAKGKQFIWIKITFRLFAKSCSRPNTHAGQSSILEFHPLARERQQAASSSNNKSDVRLTARVTVRGS